MDETAGAITEAPGTVTDTVDSVLKGAGVELGLDPANPTVNVNSGGLSISLGGGSDGADAGLGIKLGG